MTKHSFPAVHKELNSVIKAVPGGLIMKSHMLREDAVKKENVRIHGLKCANKSVKQCISLKKIYHPEMICLLECLNHRYELTESTSSTVSSLPPQ